MSAICKSIKSYEEFLKQEKFLIEKELSDMLTSYDDLSQDYNLIDLQLQEAKVETKNALDSLRLLKSDLSIITRFKDQLIVLKSKSKIRSTWQILSCRKKNAMH